MNNLRFLTKQLTFAVALAYVSSAVSVQAANDPSVSLEAVANGGAAATESQGLFSWITKSARSVVSASLNAVRGRVTSHFSPSQTAKSRDVELATAPTSPASPKLSSPGGDSDLSAADTDEDGVAKLFSDSPVDSSVDSIASEDSAATKSNMQTALACIQTHKKQIACTLVAMPLAWFSAKAAKEVVSFETHGLEFGLFGTTPILENGETIGFSYNNTIGYTLSKAAFAFLIIPNFWEFAVGLNAIPFKSANAKNWPRARVAANAMVAVYALINASQYIAPLAEYDGITYAIKIRVNPTIDPYFTDFMITAPPYLLSHAVGSHNSANNLNNSLFNRLVEKDGSEAGLNRQQLIKKLKSKARQLDSLNDAELLELWDAIAHCDTDQTRASALLTGSNASLPEIAFREPLARRALGHVASAIGAAAGAGLFYSGKYVGGGLAKNFGFDEETQEIIGNSCGAVVLAISAPVKIAAKKKQITDLYDCCAGYNPDGLNVQSFPHVRKLAAIKNVLAGWVLASTKVAMAAVAFNNNDFANPRSTEENIAVLTTLGLADGAVFGNNMKKRDDQILETFIVNACKPDATGMGANFRKQPALLRDYLRLKIREAITALQQMTNEDVMKVSGACEVSYC